jgi:hypothetical protein
VEAVRDCGNEETNIMRSFPPRKKNINSSPFLPPRILVKKGARIVPYYNHLW